MSIIFLEIGMPSYSQNNLNHLQLVNLMTLVSSTPKIRIQITLHNNFNLAGIIEIMPHKLVCTNCPHDISVSFIHLNECIKLHCITVWIWPTLNKITIIACSNSQTMSKINKFCILLLWFLFHLLWHHLRSKFSMFTLCLWLA